MQLREKIELKCRRKLSHDVLFPQDNAHVHNVGLISLHQKFHLFPKLKQEGHDGPESLT